MPLLSSATVLRLVDSMAIVLAQAHQLARARVPIRARDQLDPQIEIRRRHYRGDPRLPILEMSVRLAA